MSKFNKQDVVRLVRCSDRFMQADRRNIGKQGTITDVIREGGMVYFEVTLANGSCDHVEAQGLEIVRRCTRKSHKREELA
jgi:hypothetical protein